MEETRVALLGVVVENPDSVEELNALHRAGRPRRRHQRPVRQGRYAARGELQGGVLQAAQ